MLLKESFGDSDGPVDQRGIPADVAPLFLALKPLAQIDIILHLPEISEEQGVFDPQLRRQIGTLLARVACEFVGRAKVPLIT
jgi:hypothetical protein